MRQRRALTTAPVDLPIPLFNQWSLNTFIDWTHWDTHLPLITIGIGFFFVVATGVAIM